MNTCRILHCRVHEFFFVLVICITNRVCVCVCVCEWVGGWMGVNAREYRCSTERQGLSGSCTVYDY